VARLRRAGCVYAEDEAALLVEAASGTDLEARVRRREDGEPLEQVLGWAAFGGLRVPVRPGVFVPRRRTELLAREARGLLGPGAVVVELCCGTGAVSLVLAAARPDLELYAADLDPAAVACAADNLAGLAEVSGGDLYAALPGRLRGRVQVLVANAPYVPTSAIALMPSEARDHEPPVALDGGADGLDVLRRVVAGAPDWLATGGTLAFECGAAQVRAATAAARAAGLVPTVRHEEDLEATVVLARSSG
jgi:release factor glutamine methyltransferase